MFLRFSQAINDSTLVMTVSFQCWSKQDNLLIEMENKGMGAQTLSTVAEKFTIVLGEASSLPTLTHISNSLRLPRVLYRTLRNE